MNIFLSYTQQDREWAKALADRLRSENLTVWDSETELYPGDNFAAKIAEALENADAMVVLVSPDSLASQWVKHEIEFALGSSRLSGRLIPIVVRPTEKMPWILQKLKTITTEGGPKAVADSVVQVLKTAA